MDLGLAYRVLPEMENGCREHGGCMAVADALDHVVERANAPRRYDGNIDAVGDRPRESDVITFLGAVAIHGGEQDLAGAESDDLLGVAYSVDSCWLAAAMRKDFPTAPVAGPRYFLGVDRHHDALIAEFFGSLFHKGAARYGRGIDRHLVRPARQQPANVIDGAYPAADGERHEAGLRRARDHVVNRVAVFVARRDIEKAEFVGAGRIIGNRRFHRIAGVAQVDEIHALDHAAILDVETGNDADLEHDV